LEAKLGGPDRADIAARAGADDNEIVVRICHVLILGQLSALPVVVAHPDRDKPELWLKSKIFLGNFLVPRVSPRVIHKVTPPGRLLPEYYSRPHVTGLVSS